MSDKITKAIEDLYNRIEQLEEHIKIKNSLLKCFDSWFKNREDRSPPSMILLDQNEDLYEIIQEYLSKNN